MVSMEAVLDDLVGLDELVQFFGMIEEEEKEVSWYRQAEQPTTADEADEAESSGGTDAAHSPPDRRQESASSGGADAAYYASWRQELHRRRGCEGSGGADARPRDILPPPPPPPKKAKKDDDAGEDDAASWSPDWWTGRDEGYADWSSDWWNCRAQSSGSSDWWKGKGYSRTGVWRDPHRRRGGKCPRWQRAKSLAKQMDSHGGDLYLQHFISKYKCPTSAAEDAETRFVESYLQ